MADVTLTRGSTLPDSSSKTDFHNLIDNATGTVSNITNADIDSAAAIADTKLAQITTAGKVATSALTVASQAQGDILYRNASTWTRLPAGTAGQILTTGGAGANPSWGGSADPTALDVVTAEVTKATSTSSEETLLTYAVPANTLGTANLIRGTAWLYVTNASSGDPTFTFRLKFGGATIAAPTYTHAAADPNSTVVILTWQIKGDGATDAQEGFMLCDARHVAGTLSTNDDTGTSAIDSTAEVTLLITVQSSVSDGNISCVLKSSTIEKLTAV